MSACAGTFLETRQNTVGTFPITFQHTSIFCRFSYAGRLLPESRQTSARSFSACFRHYRRRNAIGMITDSGDSCQAGNITHLCQNISTFFCPISVDFSYGPDWYWNCVNVLWKHLPSVLVGRILLELRRNWFRQLGSPDIWPRNFHPIFVVFELSISFDFVEFFTTQTEHRGEIVFDLLI